MLCNRNKTQSPTQSQQTFSLNIKYNRCCLIEEVNNTRGRVDQTYEKVDQTKGQKLRD